MILASLFTQWVDGLSTALLWLERRLRRPERFLLRVNSKNINLFRMRGSMEEQVFSSSTQPLESVPEKLVQQTRDSTIEIVVPTAAIMERRLDPLPAESLSFIDNVVLHRIESIFPWHSDDTLFSIKTEKRSNGLLDVSVQATSRSAIKVELALATACNASEVLITAKDQDLDGQNRKQILASIGSDYERKLERARAISRFAAVAVLVSSFCVLGWTTYARWSVSSDIAALDQAIADRRALLKRSLEAGASAQSRGLEAKKRLNPPTVVVLDNLSSLLPDGTYLTDLTLEGARLRITGISSNAVDLIPLLENSGQFKNASFYAPTTRLSEGTSDRFSIEATLVPLTLAAP